MPPVFSEASFVAQEVINSGFDFTNGTIVYNKFKCVFSKMLVSPFLRAFFLTRPLLRSAVAYETSARPVLSAASLGEKTELNAYEELDSEVLKNYSVCDHWLSLPQNTLFFSLLTKTTRRSLTLL